MPHPPGSTSHFLYFLRTSDDQLYTGITRQLDRRLAAHRTGRGARFTQAHEGALIVYSEEHSSLASARNREIQIKKWSRAKKEALIKNNILLLKQLAKRHPS